MSIVVEGRREDCWHCMHAEILGEKHGEQEQEQTELALIP